jgi:glycosyltransferase involved in cell wall biosynthesis
MDVAPGNGIRVLVLSKRQYMSNDLIDDRYGRFRELPLAMSALGADVRGLCLSYRRRPETTTIDSSDDACVAWTSLNVHRLFSAGASGYWRTISRIGTEFRPDLVWACSDVPHAVIGARAAKQLGCPLVVDLYDNFESYPLARVPGVNLMMRRAVRAADGITCVSDPLVRLVSEKYRATGAIEVIENAIPSGVFLPGNQQAARGRFALPAQGILIGTAGALSRERGTDQLIAAFQKLALERPDVHLVLAGPLDPDLSIPTSDRIHYLNLLPHDAVPQLLPALDVSVVCIGDTAFGRYCFPQKLYESLACGVPVAVSKVGAMAELLRAFPENVYEPGSVDSLYVTLRRLCQTPSTPNIPVPTWTTLGEKLLRLLRTVARSSV